MAIIFDTETTGLNKENQKINIENKTIKNWCNLIAWLINCDDLRFFGKSKNRTAEDIFDSNDEGELFFLLEAIEWLRQILPQIKEPVHFKEKIQKALNGEEVKVTSENATSLGLICRTIIWKQDDEFKRKAHEIFLGSVGEN